MCGIISDPVSIDVDVASIVDCGTILVADSVKFIMKSNAVDDSSSGICKVGVFVREQVLYMSQNKYNSHLCRVAGRRPPDRLSSISPTFDLIIIGIIHNFKHTQSQPFILS